MARRTLQSAWGSVQASGTYQPHASCPSCRSRSRIWNSLSDSGKSFSSSFLPSFLSGRSGFLRVRQQLYLIQPLGHTDHEDHALYKREHLKTSGRSGCGSACDQNQDQISQPAGLKSRSWVWCSNEVSVNAESVFATPISCFLFFCSQKFNHFCCFSCLYKCSAHSAGGWCDFWFSKYLTIFTYISCWPLTR